MGAVCCSCSNSENTDSAWANLSKLEQIKVASDEIKAKALPTNLFNLTKVKRCSDS